MHTVVFFSERYLLIHAGRPQSRGRHGQPVVADGGGLVSAVEHGRHARGHHDGGHSGSPRSVGRGRGGHPRGFDSGRRRWVVRPVPFVARVLYGVGHRFSPRVLKRTFRPATARRRLPLGRPRRYRASGSAAADGFRHRTIANTCREIDRGWTTGGVGHSSRGFIFDLFKRESHN